MRARLDSSILDQTLGNQQPGQTARSSAANHIPAPRCDRLAVLLWLLLLAAPGMQAAQTLHGHIPSAVFRTQPLGRLAASKRLDVVVALPLRNLDVLTNLLQQLYDPASTNFHHYLTPQQFTEKFGPTEADYEALSAFARSNHLSITGIHPNRTLLDVSGTVAELEHAFHVMLHEYPHPAEARTFYAPDVEPSLDVSVPVLAVSGLDNYNLPRPMSGRQTAPMRPGGVTPAGGSAPDGFSYFGNDFRAAYVPGVGLNGAGQSVGLLQLDGYYPSDITTYETQAGLPNVPLTNVLVDGVSGTPDGITNFVAEVSLDIEMVISMAPGLSRVLVYEGTVPFDILNRMANDNLASQLSSSWFIGGQGDGDQITPQIAQQFVAQGQTFFQASGDFGAYFSGVNQQAGNPNTTLVGGTFLSTTGPGGSWASETAWNNYAVGTGTNSTGGGITGYPIPSWQQGIDMSGNGGSTSSRNSPDVAMVGANVWVYYMNGLSNSFWGTSIAAPLWAGFTALVNQQAAALGHPPVGFVNPVLYSLAKGQGYSSYFHDVISGNNTNVFSPTQYFARAGYDLCTGWGTPTGATLINTLASYAGAVWVAYGAPFPGAGTYDSPYSTLNLGATAVVPGGTIAIKGPGSGAETLTINKAMTLQAAGGAVTIGQ